ncbi:hypothetical protein H1R20_g7321, partial [Candolleomyces eurysporus]
MPMPIPACVSPYWLCSRHVTLHDAAGIAWRRDGLTNRMIGYAMIFSAAITCLAGIV